MKTQVRMILWIGALSLLLASAVSAQTGKPLKKCAGDAVISGTVCIDTYEASIWRVPDPLGANKALVKKIQMGKADVDDLTDGGATQLGVASANYAPCVPNGSGCTDVFAVSVPGVTPSGFATWFQAQQACKNARKRLPTNAEWQAAVVGTPGPGPDNGTTDCNTASTFAVSTTGSRSSCRSADGAFDMVGNLYEWIAEWVPRSTGCTTWSSDVSQPGVLQCLLGAATTGDPGAIARGGNFAYDNALGAAAGPLSIVAFDEPSQSTSVVGFRCAR
jgi:hypothetical protein